MSDILQSPLPEQGEIVKPPELLIQPQTAEQEFAFLRKLSTWMDFFNKRHYDVELPTTTKLLTYFQNAKELPDDIRLKRLFEKEYDPSFYQPGLQNLKAHEQAIRSIFPTLVDFHNRWGFRIFPEYSVYLTRYGPGGFYDSQNAIIRMMTRADGTFKRSHPGHTVVHEIVHIGLEEDIVERFKLTHGEKEGLVDKVCFVAFGDKLPGYETQDKGCRAIFKWLGDDFLKDLPSAIEGFKSNQQK